jgi:ABC-type multidrug transport system ATPase subunit
MRVDELLRYTQAFYPKWDAAYAEELRQQFSLDPAAKIKNLSRGETAKAGLLLALAHRPDLLVLDEPSSGLDPLVRRDILEAIIRAVADEGRTVFFSSHLLDEIERASDHLAMIHDGKIVLCGPLDEIKESHHQLTLRFEAPQLKPPILDGALNVEGVGLESLVLLERGKPCLVLRLERLDLLHTRRVLRDHLVRGQTGEELLVVRVDQRGSADVVIEKLLHLVVLERREVFRESREQRVLLVGHGVPF